jgi:hypothetical protein
MAPPVDGDFRTQEQARTSRTKLPYLVITENPLVKITAATDNAPPRGHVLIPTPDNLHVDREANVERMDQHDTDARSST